MARLLLISKESIPFGRTFNKRTVTEKHDERFYNN